MLFNSLSFLLFFPTVFLIYYSLKQKHRVLFLLAASCYFYMSFVPVYVLILFGLITIDFFLGLQIERAVGKKRLIYLVISICSNLSILFLFKYFNFFNESAALFAQYINWNYSPTLFSFILPLGLSFRFFSPQAFLT
jgi:D-alanyl-lipoteichoic acid acyltransferase DltB (MBOAT superfamily)